jgi:hypothetical protein
MEQVRRACEDIGFLAVTGHGIAPDLLDWPNINPFRLAGSVITAVPLARGCGPARRVRRLVRTAHAAVATTHRDQVGIYQADGALRVLPFELRFLARRQPPDQWLVDLSRDAEVLLPPQAYPRGSAAGEPAVHPGRARAAVGTARLDPRVERAPSRPVAVRDQPAAASNEQT